MIDTEEGTEFYGWKRVKQYRYTKEEVINMVKGKVFKHTTDIAKLADSMGSGFMAFGM